MSVRVELTPIPALTFGVAGLTSLSRRTEQATTKDTGEFFGRLNTAGFLVQGELLWGEVGATASGVERTKATGRYATVGYTIAGKLQPVIRYGYLNTDKTVTLGNNSSYALFAPFLASVPPYKCPADRSLWSIGGKMVNELRSYSMNSYVATPPANLVGPIELNTAYRVYMRSTDLANDLPANRFVFMDVNPASICTPAFGVDMSLQTFIHYPSSLHRGLGVVSFADSHVESHKWLDPRTRKGLPVGQQYIPHNDPSPNNKDLRWIAERATSRK